MGEGREAEGLALVDGTEAAGDEGGQDRGGDLEDVGVEFGAGGENQLHDPQEAAQEEGDGEVDGTSAKGKRSDADRREAVDEYKDPGSETVGAFGDFVEAIDGFFDANHVMNDFLVDSMGVVELTEIDRLSDANNAYVCCLPGGVAKGDNHAAGHIEKLRVDLQDPCAHAHVLFQPMSGRTIRH